MSFNTPDPSGGPHSVPQAAVVPLDGMTGRCLTDPQATPLKVTGIMTFDAGSKITSTPDLPTGGSGPIGWLSQIWSTLAGTLTVSTGQITTTTATIASGASITGNIDLGLMRLGRIVMPAAWDAANLTLQTSHDGADWTSTGLYDATGSEYTITAAAGRSILVPLVDMLSVRYLRIRSGTSGAPVNQTAARSIILVLVP